MYNNILLFINHDSQWPWPLTVTQDVDLHGVPPSQGASIKVISTKDGVQREVTYGSLDKKAQEEVLTDLLVKSAVHYAMKKQQVSILLVPCTS